MTVWVGTSWKMNKTLRQAREYAVALASMNPGRWSGVQPFIIPPATALAAVAAELPPSSTVLLGAQNAHWTDSGAWTGELSMLQVADAGARMVEIGHSERREHFAETDRTVNLKVHAALRHELLPLVCVGEPDAVFRAGGSVDYVLRQVHAALDGIVDTAEVLVAYEPIWAIGEAGRPADPEDISGVFSALDEEFGGRVRGVLYGGSVSSTNASSILEVNGVNGLFLGRSAWEVEGYVDILERATAHIGRSSTGTS